MLLLIFGHIKRLTFEQFPKQIHRNCNDSFYLLTYIQTSSYDRASYLYYLMGLQTYIHSTTIVWDLDEDSGSLMSLIRFTTS